MILAADNVNAMNPVVADAMERLDPRPIGELAGRMVAAGADLIDVNPGYLSRRKRDRMAFLVEAIEDATEVGLILDSPDAEVLKLGLAATRRPPILSAVTLEPAKLDGVLPLAVEQGTDLVALLLDDRSMAPPRVEEKLGLAVEIWRHATDAGLDPDRLIIDPVLPNLSWPDALDQVKASIETVRMIASGDLFGAPLRTMAGLSNLLSGVRAHHPAAIEPETLRDLAEAGLSIGLVDARNQGLTDLFSRKDQRY